MSRRMRATVILAIVLTGAAAFYWGYFLPSQEAATYERALDRRERELGRSAENLIRTLALPVFSDLTENPEVCRRNLDEVSQRVDEHRNVLQEFERSLGYEEPTYLYGLTRDYARLDARHHRDHAAINQSAQVLDRFEVLVEFLAELTAIRTEYLAVTGRLASVSDLNVYAGRSAELRADADSLARLANQLAQLTAPAELEPLRDKIVLHYRELEGGYRGLAAGIDTAVDDMIYGAARRIEQSVETYYRDFPTEYSNVMESSATLKEIQELPDKYVSS